MAGKHTPGPWTVPHFARPDVNCSCEYVLCDHLMGAVASVHCSGEGGDWQNHGDNPRYDEAVANAHLIAAAPELLEALNLMVSNFAGLLNDDDHDRVHAAIARAKGEDGEASNG